MSEHFMSVSISTPETNILGFPYFEPLKDGTVYSCLFLKGDFFT